MTKPTMAKIMAVMTRCRNPSRQVDARYAERNMEEGRTSHRRSRHHEDEGGNSGPHLNHPIKPAGAGVSANAAPTNFIKTGRGGGSGSSSHTGGDGQHDYPAHEPNESGENRQNYRQNTGAKAMGGDSYAYQNPRYRNQPRYDLSGTEQPDIGHHYGEAHRAYHTARRNQVLNYRRLRSTDPQFCQPRPPRRLVTPVR